MCAIVNAGTQDAEREQDDGNPVGPSRRGDRADEEERKGKDTKGKKEKSETTKRQLGPAEGVALH